jgi:hypothetical protein
LKEIVKGQLQLHTQIIIYFLKLGGIFILHPTLTITKPLVPFIWQREKRGGGGCSVWVSWFSKI